MTHNLDNIDYSHLSAAERLLLVQDILDSILADAQAEALTPAQVREFDRRCAAVDAGEMATFPWEDVKHSQFPPQTKRMSSTIVTNALEQLANITHIQMRLGKSRPQRPDCTIGGGHGQRIRSVHGEILDGTHQDLCKVTLDQCINQRKKVLTPAGWVKRPVRHLHAT